MPGLPINALLPRVEDPIPDAIGLGNNLQCRGCRLRLAACPCIARWAPRPAAGRLGSEGSGRGVFGWVTALPGRAGGSANLKTMTRTSTAALVISSLITGLVVVVLTALTGAGAGGAYAFLFLGLLTLGIFLLWPDL